MAFQIISDSSCDLTVQEREQYGIQVVPFYIAFDEEHYMREVEDIAIRDVYAKMVEHPDVFPKTSLPSVMNYVDVFTPYAEAGEAVICICFTPSLSGSYNAACNAKEIVCEDFPEAKITVINSQSGTVSQELYVMQAAKLREAGRSYEETVAAITNPEFMHSSHIFFTVGNTDYLQHGGRIGRVAGAVSSKLNLKPLIILEDGSIDAAAVVRSRKRSLAKCIEITKRYFEKTGENPDDYLFRVGYGYDREEGEAFLQQVKEAFSGVKGMKQTPLVQIGATICVHTGPHAIGIGAIRKLL